MYSLQNLCSFLKVLKVVLFQVNANENGDVVFQNLCGKSLQWQAVCISLNKP